MSTQKEKFDALIDAALENGETMDSFGDYDEKSEEGHDVSLIKHGGLWLVVERNDEDENVEHFLDKSEACEAFVEIQEKIEEEESANTAE
jgi:hypothetical protein